jgi:hypothetical protein
MASAILRAIDARRDDPDWAAVAEQFAPRFSAVKLAAFLDGLAGLQGDRMSVLAINTRHFDIRLGRHHMKVPGTNGLPQDLISFCNALSERSESELASLGSSDDPELRIGELAPSNRVSRFFRRLKQ